MSEDVNSIWETITVEPCIVREGEVAGWVYFIACRETRRCKIGFTRGDVEKRLKALQTGAAGELTLIAKHPGTPDTERRIHQRFAAQRLHGEWFEMSEEIFAYICLTVWLMASLCIKEGALVEQWMLTGLQMMRDSVGAPLPEELEALLGEGQLRQ